MADESTPITRVLSVHQNVHIYAIPPLTSNAGFSASSWTSPPRPTAQEIFQARMRILEHSSSASPPKITAEILLEDSKTGELFAAAPYTSAAVVQSAKDSSRFFAIRVQGEGGRKATLGLGFEERGEAFEFGVVLGDLRRGMGWEQAQQVGGGGKAGGDGKRVEEVKRDFSLKEGERIHINIGGKGQREVGGAGGEQKDEGSALFSIAPPPAGAGGFPAPPPAAPNNPGGKSAQELGFDDGEFGEFQ